MIMNNQQPGEFVHVIGDTHVYINHEDALREQLTREPRPFPTVRVLLYLMIMIS